MEDEGLTYIQFLREGIKREIEGGWRYTELRTRRVQFGSNSFIKEQWRCSYPGCQAYYNVLECGDTYRIIERTPQHNHDPSKAQDLKQHSSSFLSRYVNSLLAAGIETQSVLRLSYQDLQIDPQSQMSPFLSISDVALSRRRERSGRKFRYAANDFESLRIFTQATQERCPKDFAYIEGDEDSFIWGYASERGIQIASESEEWHLDSTYKLTSRRVALYAIVSRAETGHGFPILYAFVEPDDAEHLETIIAVFFGSLHSQVLRRIVSDCSLQIMKAIRDLFEDSVSHRWCAFHVLRAIIHTSKLFKLRPRFKRFLAAMHKLTCEIISSDQIDEQLKEIESTFINESRAETYYRKQWEPYKQYWIRGLQPDADNTNNLNEAHFHALKFRYLGHRFNFRLDELAVMLITTVIPDIQIRLFNDLQQQGKLEKLTEDAEAEDEVSEEEKLGEFYRLFTHYSEMILKKVQEGTIDRELVIAGLKNLII